MLKFSSYFLAIILVMVFSGCQNSNAPKSRLTPEEQAKYITKGKSITMFSFKAFTKELTDAINHGGIQYAVGYCQLNASRLVDSLSRVHKVSISRISNKYRNPADKPDELDKTVLDSYQEQFARGDKLQPHLEATNTQVIFYSPILILDPMCLNCHGDPGSTMPRENYDFIKSKYPDDMATGYQYGDLRGAWKIVFGSDF